MSDIGTIGAAIAQRIKLRAPQLGYQIGDLLSEAGLQRHYLDTLSRAKFGPYVGKLWTLRPLLSVTWDWLIAGGADENGEPTALASNGSELSVRDAIDRREALIGKYKSEVNTLLSVMGKPPRYPDVS